MYLPLPKISKNSLPPPEIPIDFQNFWPGQFSLFQNFWQGAEYFMDVILSTLAKKENFCFQGTVVSHKGS
jgi:hypothetical protein